VKENRAVLNILLVEDSRTFREAFKSALQDRFPSSTVDEVISAEDALQRVSDLRHSRRLVVCEPLKAVVNLGPPQRWQLPA